MVKKLRFVKFLSSFLGIVGVISIPISIIIGIVNNKELASKSNPKT